MKFFFVVVREGELRGRGGAMGAIRAGLDCSFSIERCWLCLNDGCSHARWMSLSGDLESIFRALVEIGL